MRKRIRFLSSSRVRASGCRRTGGKKIALRFSVSAPGCRAFRGLFGWLFPRFDHPGNQHRCKAQKKADWHRANAPKLIHTAGKIAAGIAVVKNNLRLVAFRFSRPSLQVAPNFSLRCTSIE
jgi:hypothetical protein